MNPNDLNEQDREDVANVTQIADNLDTMSRWLRMDYYRRNYMVRRGKWGTCKLTVGDEIVTTGCGGEFITSYNRFASYNRFSYCPKCGRRAVYEGDA